MGQVLAIVPKQDGAPQIVFGRALVHRLVDLTSDLTHIPVSELCGPTHYRDVAYARFAIMLAAREKGKALVQIGRVLGGRDHSTVKNGLAGAARLEASDPAFAELMRRLREEAWR